jgi:hypothetical protein
MKLNKLVERARQMVDKRGGTDALKQDAQELRDIAKGPGSLGDKAKQAAAALKDPGGATAADAGPPPGGTHAPAAEQATPEPEQPAR